MAAVAEIPHEARTCQRAREPRSRDLAVTTELGHPLEERLGLAGRPHLDPNPPGTLARGELTVGSARLNLH